MRKHALVNGNIVTDIKSLNEEEVLQHIATNEMVIDIEDLNPQPALRWVLNGNTLEIPTGQSSREKFEEELAERKTDFGIKLSRTCVNRIGARNKILDKNGAQVTAILNSLLPVKALLETGALGTARNACAQLKVVYTEYADVFQYGIDEINKFEQDYGL